MRFRCLGNAILEDTMFKESVNQQTAEQGAVFSLSVADAKHAVSYVRGRATEFGVDPWGDRLQRRGNRSSGSGCVISGTGGT